MKACFGLCLVSAVVLLAGCSKKTSSVATSTESALITISGRASAGNIKNAAVKAYCKTFETRGDQIGETAITDSNGIYNLILPSNPGCSLEIVVSDAGDNMAKYIEEATGIEVALGATEIRALVPEPDSSQKNLTVAVTVLTELAVSYYESQEDQYASLTSAQVKTVIEAANAFMAQASGVSDILGTIPANSQVSEASASDEAKKYAAFLAGISQRATDIALDSLDLMSSLSGDIAFDNVFDSNWNDISAAYGIFVASPYNVTDLDGTYATVIEAMPSLPEGYALPPVEF
ncbi:MAG: hypothetical protein HYV97_05045 [Bdellovibrio sp.]|nr:hypothetical protein [Bdellovibrio sp.]